MRKLFKNNALRVLLCCLLVAPSCVNAQQMTWRTASSQTSDEFFKSAEAQRIGDLLLLYQRCTGGWPKNIDMAKPLTAAQRDSVIREKSRKNDSTTDNSATNRQMMFLARLYRQTHKGVYREAFQRGLDYLLSGQYDNGGWPQFWPENRDYQVHITYNDDAMVNTMTLIRDVYERKVPYDCDLINSAMDKRLRKAFDKGVDCILNTQIMVNGEPTIWCQQHDHETLQPAKARAYELPSFGTMESASIVRLLMQVPNPDKRVKRAVRGAMAWFDKYKLTGLRYTHIPLSNGKRETLLVSDKNAKTPLWARYYDLKNCEPFVCDRDGIPRKHLEEIGAERRNGYGWYGDRPASLYAQYSKWADRYDKANKLNISLDTKGANENGTLSLNGKRLINYKSFDVIVRPGESIQSAIEKAPTKPTQPFNILLLKGTYNQKVIIDRPNIVLVGEDRDSTIIVLAETAKTCKIKEYNGKTVGNGVVYIQEGADDCLISGLTVYNNYGTTIEKTTTHQMAVMGRATRTIIINSNIFADGNDALALWAKGGQGMYYHADLYLRCPGVDFLCPRGWCYATRCRFYGDSRAIIWHDGRGDKSQKLVITNSEFDAKSPTKLGRWHHDSQFFLVNCKLSKQILDSNIGYAYSDKVLDPCPWGQRVYYYGCTREGGHSGWLNDNIQESEEKPEFHTITAQWTFAGKWDPESRIRDLWDVVGY